MGKVRRVRVRVVGTVGTKVNSGPRSILDSGLDLTPSFMWFP